MEVSKLIKQAVLEMVKVQKRNGLPVKHLRGSLMGYGYIMEKGGHITKQEYEDILDEVGV
jgi:hypothetical protein